MSNLKLVANAFSYRFIFIVRASLWASENEKEKKEVICKEKRYPADWIWVANDVNFEKNKSVNGRIKDKNGQM